MGIQKVKLVMFLWKGRLMEDCEMQIGEGQKERLVPDIYLEEVGTRMNSHSGQLYLPTYMFVVLSSVSMGVTSSC